jgi:alkaline phosphatase D
MVGIRNYGVLNVSGPRKERVLTMTVKDAEGNPLWTRSIGARNGYALE